MLTLVVVLGEDDLDALPASLRVAAASGPGFALAFARKQSPSGLEQVPADEREMPELMRAAVDRIEAAGMPVPTLYSCRAGKVERALLNAIAELGATQLIIPACAGENSGSAPLIDRLVQIAPVEVLVIAPGSLAVPPGRVLIPQFDGGGALAIRYSISCGASAGAELRAMVDPTAAGRSRRVFKGVLERLSEKSRVQLTQVEVEGSLEKALLQEIRAGDLVLLDIEDIRRAPRFLSMLGGLQRAKADVAFAVGVVRDDDAVGPGRLQRAIERIRLHMPALHREERRDLYQLLERGGSLSADFVVMLALSALIASLGLIQSSAGVVIGAMLVAPLMTPLLAIGVSLVQGNIQLFRRSCGAVAVGVLGALMASMAIGLLSPWSDLSSEIVARGSPNVFDLLIALFSGIAAAYALARPGLAGMLVGVAIAVALVPPLASVGITIVKGQFSIAMGAAVLFLTNLLAIVFGAALVFRFFGLDAPLRGRRAPRWVLVTSVFIALAMIPTVSDLFHNLRLQTDQGVHRAYARPLPAAMRESILARVASAHAVQVIFMADSEIEHGFGRQVILASEGQVDPELERDLRAILGVGLDAKAPVNVMFVRSASAVVVPRER